MKFARWITVGYIIFSTFMFFLPASRSLWNEEYRWGNGYFFRAPLGGASGFLLALFPFLLGLAILVIAKRGKSGAFAVLALAWSAFQLANTLLAGGTPTFRGDTYQVEWTSVIIAALFIGWPVLALFSCLVLLRRAEFGWTFKPLARGGWTLIAAALLLGLVTGYLERSGPMVSVANRFAVLFTIAQYMLLIMGVSVGARSASAPVIDRKLKAHIGGE